MCCLQKWNSLIFYLLHIAIPKVIIKHSKIYLKEHFYIGLKIIGVIHTVIGVMHT